MNTAFLKYIADNIPFNPQTDDLRTLKDHCFVFPTRRAGVYFKKYLTERFPDQFIWSPYVFSIVEFTQFLSDKVILDPVTMVLELYKIYHLYEPETKFDKFYPWGLLLIKDFDEIDKYMVDHKQLFANLRDIRQMDEFFEMEDEQFEFLKQFWNVLNKEQNTDLESEFIRIWEILGDVYEEFKENLLQNNAAYEGMAQREILEKLKNGSLQLPFSRIVFAGFNALSTAEETLFDYLSDKPIDAKIYWDSDAYYMSNSKQEANKFLSRYYQKWKDHPKHDWTQQTDFRLAAKNIHIIGIPLKVGQAKYTGQLLQGLVEEKKLEISESALVLGDESLLFPMLYALPNDIENINITMGYPLKDSPLYRLLETLVQLQKTALVTEAGSEKPEAGSRDATSNTSTTSTVPKIAFYSKFILQIINNPYIQAFDKEGIKQYTDYIEYNNLIYINSDSILQRLKHPIFRNIFTKASFFLELVEVFNDVLVRLFTRIKEELDKEEDLNSKTEEVTEEDKGNSKKAVELEFIYHTLLQLKKLEETLRKYRQTVTNDTFWKLFREVIQTVKLPFTGEPLQGLQIMGFLETRTLDFKNIFALGINEGAIPSSKPHQTFIPFNLRKGFKMPTFLDQDAIYAYHFYHLLQRAENVYLIYNTEIGDFGSGEKSRFLLQIEHELELLAPDIKIQKHIIATPLQSGATSKEPLEIAKNEAIMAELNRFIEEHPEAKEHGLRRFSPSALSTYITCPVQFYFKHIANLYELESVKEDITNLVFGNILHHTIEFTYNDFIYQRIRQKNLLDRNKVLHTLHKQLVVKQFYSQVFRSDQLEKHKDHLNQIAPDLDLWLTDTLQKINSQERKSLEQKLNQDFKQYHITQQQWKRKLQRQAKRSIVREFMHEDPNLAMLQPEDIKALRLNEKELKRKLDEAFSESNFDSQHLQKGKNLLLQRVIINLVKKILGHDEKDAPFKIVGLESSEVKVTLNIGSKTGVDDDREVALKGVIDRVDEIILEDGKPAFRIIDYKTGTVEFVSATAYGKPVPIDAYFHKYFDDPKYKAGFQIYLYSYLYWRQERSLGVERPRILAGIYSLKEVNKGIRYLRGKKLIDNKFFEAFEVRLKEMLQEIFDEEQDFVQTDKEDRYKFSPYKRLVNF
ncbi:MAG: PD-(D/E)XK nuclease family protein [Chitinophagales bacterium]